MAQQIPEMKGNYDQHRGTLYYYDWETREDETLQNDEKMYRKFEKLTGEQKEKIRHIYMYKTPLTDRQRTQGVLYHAFIVFSTKEGNYYSVEISDKCVTVQKSSDHGDVRDKYPDGDARKILRGSKGPELMCKSRARKTMRHVIKYLYEKDILNTRYHILANVPNDIDGNSFVAPSSHSLILRLILHGTQNCQSLSRDLFRKFAANSIEDCVDGRSEPSGNDDSEPPSDDDSEPSGDDVDSSAIRGGAPGGANSYMDALKAGANHAMDRSPEVYLLKKAWEFVKK